MIRGEKRKAVRRGTEGKWNIALMREEILSHGKKRLWYRREAVVAQGEERSCMQQLGENKL